MRISDWMSDVCSSDLPFHVYRLFLIVFGVAMAITIWQFLERTRLGLLIRATSQNSEMVHALGGDVNWIRSGVFGIGDGLAALGGVLRSVERGVGKEGVSSCRDRWPP